jgi:hypothetical protein
VAVVVVTLVAAFATFAYSDVLPSKLATHAAAQSTALNMANVDATDLAVVMAVHARHVGELSPNLGDERGQAAAI